MCIFEDSFILITFKVSSQVVKLNMSLLKGLTNCCTMVNAWQFFRVAVITLYRLVHMYLNVTVSETMKE